MAPVSRLLLLILCVVPLLGASAPSLIVESSNLVRIYNVRLQQEEGFWLIRGRVTRADKDLRVSSGHIVAVRKKDNRRLGVARFKPQFVHRKTKRASYFTLRIDIGSVPEDSAIRLYFLD